jgi:hypothetical protein
VAQLVVDRARVNVAPVRSSLTNGRQRAAAAVWLPAQDGAVSGWLGTPSEFMAHLVLNEVSTMLRSDKGIDFIAYDNVGRVILVAEVKRRLGTSEHWATHFRRNMLAHGVLPKSPFFLIATPERMYFWKQDQQARADEPPAFTLDATKALKPYLDKLNRPPQAIGEQALELLVSSWLSDMAGTDEARVRQDPSMRWLAESGLLDSLGTGRIELNPA